MKEIELEDDIMDAEHGPTRLLLLAEYWKEQALRARAAAPPAAVQPASVGEAAPMNAKPVGYVFGNSYWEEGNPRLTDEIRKLGSARYASKPSEAKS